MLAHSRLPGCSRLGSLRSGAAFPVSGPSRVAAELINCTAPLPTSRCRTCPHHHWDSTMQLERMGMRTTAYAVIRVIILSAVLSGWIG